MTPEAQSRVAQLRRISTERELTLDEVREVVKILREDRIGAYHASDTKRKREAKVVIPEADDLLGELGAL